MTILVESMTKITVRSFTVRVWRQQDSQIEFCYEGELYKACNDAKDDPSFSMRFLANSLIALPDVNAVEVLDLDGNGLVLYNNWP